MNNSAVWITQSNFRAAVRPWTLLTLLVALLLLMFVFRIGVFVAAQQIPFDADEAHHASRGLEVFSALKSIDGSALVQVIKRQSFYPPLHSLLVGTAYLFAAPSLGSSRIPSLCIFGLYLILLFFVAFKVLTQIGASEAQCKIAALFSVCLGAGSPMMIYNSSLCMLEPLSVLLTTLLLFDLCFAFSQKQALQRGLRHGTLLFLIFLSKYSVGVLVALAFGLHLALEFLRQKQSKLIKHAAGVVAVFLVGLAVWFALASFDSFLYFASGHPSRGFELSTKRLLFYPQIFLKHYTLALPLSVLAIALCMVSLKFLSRSATLRFAAVLIAVTMAVFSFSREQGARHILFLSPEIWLLSAAGFYQLIGHLGDAGKKSRVISALTALIILLLSLYPQIEFEWLKERIQKKMESTSGFLALSEFAVSQSDPSRAVLLLGTTDQMSAEWMRWLLAVRSGKGYREINIDQYPFDKRTRDIARYTGVALAKPWTDRSFPQKPLEKVIAQRYYGTLVIVRAAKEGPTKKKKDALAELMREKTHTRLVAEGQEIIVIRL